MGGLILAAPRSDSGKTMVALGLLRALRQRGSRVAAAKVGPDYIDSGFLGAAAGAPCHNLDSWAMRRTTIAARVHALEGGSDIVLCEGVMGLFDGAGLAGEGSTAAIAALTGWPVVLVIDVSGQAASVAALVEGFARHRKDIDIVGVIFNRVAGDRHAAMLSAALQRALPGMKILGRVPRGTGLDLPSRHLGLVPAGETPELEPALDRAASIVGAVVDLDGITALARRTTLEPTPGQAILPRLGAHIAVARDPAFAFAYPAILDAWRADGTAVSFFSPLADEAPVADADAVYLPGGYPELHAPRLAASRSFLSGLRAAASRGAVVYGECGGYMVLGETLTDADGNDHAMAGLLPLKTSFAARKLHLGYRQARLDSDGIFGKAGSAFRGHEFHYARIVAEGDGRPLFQVNDADGNALPPSGRVDGNVMGSFVHLIDRV